MTDLHIVVLAAGKGTRMKSALAKVLHPAGGLPLIEHVLRTAAHLEPNTVTLILGHQAEAVQASIAARPGLAFALQEPQLGTGHALLQAEGRLSDATGTVILLSGDVPLLRAETLRFAWGSTIVIVTALMSDPLAAAMASPTHSSPPIRGMSSRISWSKTSSRSSLSGTIGNCSLARP